MLAGQPACPCNSAGRNAGPLERSQATLLPWRPVAGWRFCDSSCSPLPCRHIRPAGAQGAVPWPNTQSREGRQGGLRFNPRSLRGTWGGETLSLVRLTPCQMPGWPRDSGLTKAPAWLKPRSMTEAVQATAPRACGKKLVSSSHPHPMRAQDHGRPQGGARPLSPSRDSGRPGRMEKQEEQERGPSRRHTRSRSREGRRGRHRSRSREGRHGKPRSRSREGRHGNHGSRSREEGHGCHDSRSRDGHSEHRERSDRRRDSEREGRRDRSGDRKRRGRCRSLGRSDPGEVETERRPHAHRHADRH